MPKWPILLLVLLAGAAWVAARRRKPADLVGAPLDAAPIEATAGTGELAAQAPIEVVLGRRLSSAWQGLKPVLSERIAALRSQQEKLSGFAFPAVVFQDGAHLGPQDYEICLHGARHSRGQLYADQTLAIRGSPDLEALPGTEARDPAFGLPAVWIAAEQRERAEALGYTLVDPITLLMTHLGEVLRTEAPLLLSRSDVAQMLEGVRTRQPGLLEELIPAMMTLSDIQRVLQDLLAEDVPIRNIDLIAEALIDLGRTVKDRGELTEQVRQRLSHVICHGLRRGRDQLTVLSLHPKVEAQIAETLRLSDGKGPFVIEPRFAEQLLRKLASLADSMMQQSLSPVLLCGPEVRRHLKTFTRRSLPRLAILSVNEVPPTVDLASFGVLTLD